MSDNSIKMILARLRRKTKIERLHPHILRHTFATNYLINGSDIFLLQQILGHTSLDMVRRYSHLASSFIIANHKRLSPLDQIQRKNIIIELKTCLDILNYIK
ncbi:tyrosine-type recombinase/integrase [Tissierella sp. MSJ-40]|uniref:Tyrosine-type recombinase/integrase n=2 Tax=Tissierella simiarum TaxID=2841534 RepID=A0ABS6E4D8_9FIRM|nr:tyrosine-type recombinase/integrase [Tissierella simiarum]